MIVSGSMVAVAFAAPVVAGRVLRKYVAVVVEAQSGKIRVLRFTDNAFIEEHSTPLTVKINTWYELRVTPIMNGPESAVLNIVVTDMLIGTTVTSSATVAQYGNPIGKMGVFAQRSYTYFNNFDIR